MRRYFEIKHSGIFAIIMTVCVFPGCAPPAPAVAPASSSCVTGVSQVLVGDNYLETGCGCAEGNGTVTGAGSSFVCTLKAKNFVQFIYVGTQLTHQIDSIGSPAFANTPLLGPANSPSPGLSQAFGLQISTPGTYQFKDAFDASLSGSFVVQ